MSAQGWFKVGRINPCGDIDLREVLNRVMGPGEGAGFGAESRSGSYVLSSAVLRKLRKRLLKQFGDASSSDPLLLFVDELLDQSKGRPVVLMDTLDEPGIDIDELLRKTPYDPANGVLFVKPEDGSMALWQRTAGLTSPLPEWPAAAAPAGVTVSDDGEPSFGELLDAPASSANPVAEAASSVDPGLLGDESLQPNEATDGNSGPPLEDTYINAVIDKYEGGPLVVNTAYAIDFSVDREPNTSVAAVAAAAVNNQLRTPGVETTLVIELYGNGFKTTPAKATLELNAEGLSTAKARFGIVPMQEGPAELVALVHKDGNFVQMVKIAQAVGQGATDRSNVVSIGRPVSAAAGLKPRRIGMIIEPEGNCFSCRVWGATQKRVTLSINQQEVAFAVELLRTALLGIVTLRDSADRFAFQIGVDIAPSVAKESLKILANAGYRLFRTIFFHDAASDDCKNLGKWLIAEANRPGPGFTMQILGEGFPIPWASLYLDPNPTWDENALDPERFLGMKHVIEQMPLGGYGSDTHIVCVPPGLAVALNLNQDIDPTTQTDVVAQQSQYWRDREAGTPALALRTSTTTEQLVGALSSPDTIDQIIYFYCHAQSVGLVGGGPDASTLTMGRNDFITLGDLKDRAPTNIALRGAPLVFINACESADLSPSFYSGFVPYFMSKGARGVIGTECKVPVLFGAAWAKSFFEEFLQGASLGELVLMKRREFYFRHNNLLGLLYGVYCNVDTQLVSEAA
jgi:hypothetical protein